MIINIICVKIETSGNLGAIARLCANFQVNKLIVINPQCRINDKEVYQRATDGSRYIDSIIKLDTLEEAVQYNDLMIALTGVDAEASVIRNPISIIKLTEDLNGYNSTIGLVLGPESTGLSNKHLKICDISATIPMLSNIKSERILNISHALSIVLYELTRDLNKYSKHMELMDKNTFENILGYYDKIMDRSTLIEHKIEDARVVFKNMINRSLLSKKEAYNLQSQLRSILLGFSLD